MGFSLSPEFEYLARVIVGRPLVDIPPALLLPGCSFSTENDVKLIANAAAITRSLIDAEAKRKGEAFILVQVAKVVADEELSADAEREITAILAAHPDIASRIPADAEHVKIYAAKCWFLVQAIIDRSTSFVDINRIILDSIAQPMSTIRHSQVAGALFHNIDALTTDTLFRYLDAVEGSCRNHKDNDAQVQHHVKHAAMVLEKALLTHPSIAKDMSIEISSFCLSYPWVKKAADLYRLLSQSLST
ncbi:hypothetical protein IWW38_001020 [Coemansia aciculifera]|uniref:Uncharacterized protein n=1 Tax=Coemansia aciculifera TaxID=417176 RepID=A0ACC1M869_9FUNG|nr:hypothetical protein IWW38_001020 [Coemansia aciculifera]